MDFSNIKYTLDSHPEDIINDPRIESTIMCDVVRRTRKWGDSTIREFANRPPQKNITESFILMKGRLWRSCDEELRKVINDYLEKYNV